MRADPGRRIRRRPDPWEALAWAITEQLIEYTRAGGDPAADGRARSAARCPRTGLRDVPTPARGGRPGAGAAVRVGPGRGPGARPDRGPRARSPRAACDLERSRPRGGLAAPARDPRASAPWTIEMLALHGQGRHDVLPAGDLGYLKLVGRLKTGDPNAVAAEEEVREMFAPYAPWAGLAASYALRLGPSAG